MSVKTPLWSRQLSNSSWVNQVAISDNGRRVIGATFIHDYKDGFRGANRPGIYLTAVFDSAGNQLWSNSFSGWDGVFAVAISGDGNTVASGGWSAVKRGFLQVAAAEGGGVMLDVATIPERVNAVALSRDGKVLVAAADNVYVFVKDDNKVYQPVANHEVETAAFFGGFVTAVAVHPSGTWLAACSKGGKVLTATIGGGAVTVTGKQVLEELSDGSAAPAVLKPIPFLSVAIAEQAGEFIVGGGNSVFHSSLAAMTAGTKPVRYDAWDAGAPPATARDGVVKLPENVRWASITADGAFFAAVANRRAGLARRGAVMAFNRGNQSTPAWRVDLMRNPNGISMDRAGQRVAVADGYPVGVAASFYMFDRFGNLVWDFETPNMNWPVAVSPDGTALAAGGDDGVLYYFQP